MLKVNEKADHCNSRTLLAQNKEGKRPAVRHDKLRLNIGIAHSRYTGQDAMNTQT